jgi:RNA polymerase sigma factor (TIGR02999 family)
MNEVTRLIGAIEQGDRHAADNLLPLVYEELRSLAAQKMAKERPGQTLEATALVHEAYIRLVEADSGCWDGRNHFFMAAAEAMRRILIESARRKKTHKRGGNATKVDRRVADLPIEVNMDLNDLLSLDEALARLDDADPKVADLVKLHCFGGLPLASAAEVLDVSVRTAERYWAFAKTWLYAEISGAKDESR